MTKPRFSILIDTYNHEQFIAAAIRSVLQQDFPMAEAEVVVVDDGSTDRTPEITRGFEPKLRLVCKTNGGQASAFNLALPQLQGEIVAMLDGDDRWAPQKLRRLADTFDRCPEVGMVGHGFYEDYGAGRPNGLILPGREQRLTLASPQEAERFSQLIGFFGTSKMALRRDLLARLLPVPEELVVEADEYLFTLAAALAPALILNEPLFYYGLHAGNLFQFQTYEAGKARRKLNVLDLLVHCLPPKLSQHGVSAAVIETLFRRNRIDIERLRLGLDGGSRRRTFQVERSAYQTAYRQVSWRHRLFKTLVLTGAWLLPPRTFYRLRRWYAERDLSRLRRWTGRPVPAAGLIEQRPDREKKETGGKDG